MFQIPELSSGGIIFSYQCSNQCRHCLYACGPYHRDWMSADRLDQVLEGIARHRGYLTGLHFAGGEPFLNPDLLEHAIRKASDLRLPVDYVETNAFWCHSKERTESMLKRMEEAGLRALLVSCSPFHQEFIPFENVMHAVTIGRRVFGHGGILVYTSYFYDQLSGIDPKKPLPFDLYVEAMGEENASLAFATEYGLIPNGRAATQLAFLYQRRPAEHYSGESCSRELSSPHHIHIDLYGNYIAGLCAGITLGDAADLDRLYRGIDLTDKPVLKCLVEGGVETLLQYAVNEYGYRELPEGYIAKCHLCLDIRRHLAGTGRTFRELGPADFYAHLDE
ncbi:radical SAM protein [bacterium]|nr:radical SAM protein [bacterium]